MRWIIQSRSKFEVLGEWIRSLIEFRLSNEGRFLRPESLEDFTYEEILIEKGGAFGLCHHGTRKAPIPG